MQGAGAIVESSQYLISIYLAQSLAAALLAWVFHRYWRVYARPYLGVWSTSFLALAFYLLGSAVAHFMATGGFAAHPLRTPLSAFSLILAYTHVMLVLVGVRALDVGAAPQRRLLAGVVVIAIFVGVGTALAFSADPAASGERILMRVALRNGITGLAYLTTSFLLLRTLQARQSFGRWFAGTAFAVYGAGLTLSASLIAAEVLFGAYLSWGTYLGAFDLVAKVMLGMGLVIWLLEDERARALAAREEAERVSLHDPLTGFSNRRHFAALLDQAVDRIRLKDDSLAVLIIGLDRFQAINNAYGSDVGDRVLAACADRLVSAADDSLLGRLEGDQFTVATAVANSNDATRVAERLLKLLDQPYRVEPMELHVPASIGVAVFPEDGVDSERLLNNGTLALRQAKRLGGHSVQFYAPALNEQARRRLSLQIELRRALHEVQFEAEYQPLFRAVDRRLAGFETLARWRHPRLGLLQPERFVPALEEIGLLAELDMMMVEMALQQLAKWQQRTQDMTLGVSVNLCARSFQRHDLADSLQKLLERSAVPAHSLIVEITESSALDDIEASRRTLERLHRLGVKVWLDDFGTGHSSLAQLLRLPVDGLKLDRTFLDPGADEPRQGALVAATTQLASALGMTVVAEGVETEDQAKFARDRGVDLLQGFLFGRPLPVEAFARFDLGATVEN